MWTATVVVPARSPTSSWRNGRSQRPQRKSESGLRSALRPPQHRVPGHIRAPVRYMTNGPHTGHCLRHPGTAQSRAALRQRVRRPSEGLLLSRREEAGRQLTTSFNGRGGHRDTCPDRAPDPRSDFEARGSAAASRKSVRVRDRDDTSGDRATLKVRSARPHEQQGLADNWHAAFRQDAPRAVGALPSRRCVGACPPTHTPPGLVEFVDRAGLGVHDHDHALLSCTRPKAAAMRCFETSSLDLMKWM